MAGPVTEVLTRIVVILIESLFLHLAAIVALGGAKYRHALIVSFVGHLVALLIFYLFQSYEVVALVLVLVVWLSICASVYKTSWIRAVLIGLLGYGLWWLTDSLIRANLPNL